MTTLNKNYQTINGATDYIDDIPARHNLAMTEIEADMTTIESAINAIPNAIATAVSDHAAIQTGIHGLAITAGKILTVQDNVTITGPLGTGAYATINNYALVGQQFYLGTTQIAINRASSAIVLTGITSIDGAAASCSGNAATATKLAATKNINNIPFDGSADVIVSAQKDGWVSVTDSWAYASANTITVPSGAASLYQKGDKIKWTQTTTKYGVIIAVADTLLTIAINSDYVVTNAAISSIYVSRAQNPFGYPTWFNYGPTYGANGSMTFTSVSTTFARFKVEGLSCTTIIAASGTVGGTPNTELSATLPITNISDVRGGGYNDVFGVGGEAGLMRISGGVAYFRRYNSSNWAGGASSIYSMVTYDI